MQYIPNSTAYSFTSFLLEINLWKYTAGGKALIELIRSASLSGSPVSEVQYFSYTRYTAWRFQSYLQHSALTS